MNWKIVDPVLSRYSVANLVGATPLTASGGKLETYIRRHCPVVLRNLVEAGILSAD